jgi:hypothetical protein
VRYVFDNLVQNFEIHLTYPSNVRLF